MNENTLFWTRELIWAALVILGIFVFEKIAYRLAGTTIVSGNPDESPH